MRLPVPPGWDKLAAPMQRAFDIFLPLTGIALLIALCIIMVRRQLHREYPYFFVYAVFSLVSAIFSAFFFVSFVNNEKTFAYAYWTSNAIAAVLVLLALNEVLYKVFHSFYSFRWVRLILPSVAFALCFFAIRQALVHPPSHYLLLSIFFCISGVLSAVPVGSLVVLMLLAMVLRVRWWRRVYDISLGFAVSSLGDWTNFVLLTKFRHSFFLRYLSPVMYICATLVWIVCFSRKFEPEPKLELGTTSRPSSRTDANSTPKLKAV
jgi:hypothetical protein